jgi:KaiC/GvpD/RAD55 family RecA-like ATPase
VRTTIGVDGIDALIEGGIPNGAAVLISGEPGTGKSVLCLQFLLAGIREGEPGVYASSDLPGRIYETAASLGWDLRGAVEDGYARVIQLGAEPSREAPAPEGGDDEAASDSTPGDMAGPPGMGAPGGPPGGIPAMAGGPPSGMPGDSSPAELSARPRLDAARASQQVISAVEEIGAQRVVIDRPALPAAGTAEDAVFYVAELLRTTMATTHCTTLLTGQRNHDSPGYTRLGIEEQIVDGIIDLGVGQRDGRRYRTLSVRAMHGTAIDMDDRPFGIMKGRGIVFGES